MKWPLTGLLTAYFVALQLIAATLTGAWFYVSMTDAGRDVARANIEAKFTEIANHTVSFLQPAERAARLTGRLADGGILDLGSGGELDTYFLGQLGAYGHFAGMFVGRPDGSFFYTKRDSRKKDSAFRTKIVETSGGTRSVRLTWRDADGKSVLERNDPEDAYDSRARPWYKLAIENRGVAWTDPYIFFTSQKPGITAAMAIGAGENAVVVGIDIEIADISAFLKNLSYATRGTALLMHKDGNVISHGTAETVTEVSEGDTKKLRFRRFDELPSALASAIPDDGATRGKILLSGDAVFRQVEHESEAYLVGLKRLAALNLPWVIGVETREASFTQVVQRNIWIGLALALAVCVLGAGAGFQVARTIGTPLAALQRNARLVLQGELGGFEIVKTGILEVRDAATALMDVVLALRKERQNNETEERE
jgi:hypothetical protein